MGHYGNHKFAYSEKTLKQFTALFGIDPLSVEKKGLNLIYKGRKARHVRFDEIKDLPIHSHANSFGDQPDVSLEYAKQKIETFKKRNI